MSLEVLKRTMLANHYSNTTLRGIADRGRTRVNNLTASGFGNTPTIQVSLDRITAATDILQARGALKVGTTSVPSGVSAIGVLTHTASLKGAALVAGGLFLAKKFL